MPTTLIRCAFCGSRVLPPEVVHTPRPAHPVCADHWYAELDLLTERRTT